MPPQTKKVLVSVVRKKGINLKVLRSLFSSFLKDSKSAKCSKITCVGPRKFSEIEF